MKCYSVLIGLLLTGCSTVVPVQQKFPDLPEVLNEKCPALDTINKPEVKLSEFMKVVIGNYQKYHNCSDLVTAWQKWYNEQKAIAENSKPKK